MGAQGCDGREMEWDGRMDLARERLELQRDVKIVMDVLYVQELLSDFK